MTVDVLVIGSGPAGQKAAIQAAKAGRRVALVEQAATVGGECVHHGTIPSKTLRETAVALATFRQRSLLPLELPDGTKIAGLLGRLGAVVHGHERYIAAQLERNGVILLHGRARFVSAHEVEVRSVRGERTVVSAAVVVIATGSVPRTPPDVPVDHERVLDSDSILSVAYLPRTLIVLGAGVIACEYASVFAVLGVRVTLVDRGPRPLAFLDPEITARFVRHLESVGGRFVGGVRVGSVESDGLHVTTTLADGSVLESDKLLCALGRVAAVERLDLAAAGLAVNARGLFDVDEYGRTAIPHIYAVGDVAGPPALATSAMAQGRRAVRHALGLPPGASSATTPVGIYTIPEMASVGLAVADAPGPVLVGRAPFEEIARGHIANCRDGLLKMVADADGRLLGVQIVGEGATELIHVAQMALVGGMTVDAFVDNVFNFPTFAEAYRVAALDVVARRDAQGGAIAARAS